MKNMKIKNAFAMLLIALSISNVYALENAVTSASGSIASTKPVTEQIVDILTKLA